MGWLSKLFNLEVFDEKKPFIGGGESSQDLKNSRVDARNRLKLVLMHDRSKLSPETLEKMRDELIAVITKYVEIDSEALRLNFETESNTIALVANIPVVRQKEDDEDATDGPVSVAKKAGDAPAAYAAAATAPISPVAKGQFDKGQAAATAKPTVGKDVAAGTPAAKADKPSTSSPQPSLV